MNIDILTIKNNNNNSDSDLIKLLLADLTNVNINSKKYQDHIENYNFEYDDHVSNKNIIYWEKFIVNEKDTIEKLINNIFLDDIKKILINLDDVVISEKLYDSYIIHYTDNYYYVLYYNRCLLELFINKVNDEKFLKIMNDHFNLFASWLIKELNPKSNTIFGSIYNEIKFK